ncbi:MAG: hypothetical protein AB7S78_03730 [Candidatus Omnitrophota bacterium]
MPRNSAVLLLIVFFLSGCTATSRHAPHFKQSVRPSMTVAVLPMEVQMYQIQAGGTAELMDEWKVEVREAMKLSLEKYFGDAYNLKLKFIDENGLKKDHREVWRKYKALYEAVATSALIHSFDITAFPSKKKNFDYTLGTGIEQLSKPLGADALLFIYGSDYIETTGRKLVAAVNLFMLEFGADTLTMGLVDGSTGDILWFKRSEPAVEFNLRDSRQLDETIKWMTDDFIKE